MRTISITGAKGGVGTSTIASALALMLAETEVVHLSPHDDDCHAILGLPGSELSRVTNARVNQSLTIGNPLPDPAIAEVDTNVVDCGLVAGEGFQLLVVRNDYLALRRVVTGPFRPNGLVLINEPGRALLRADIVDATGIRVLAEIEYEPRIYRAIDAGLFSSLLPQSVRKGLAPLLTLMPFMEPAADPPADAAPDRYQAGDRFSHVHNGTTYAMEVVDVGEDGSYTVRIAR